MPLLSLSLCIWNWLNSQSSDFPHSWPWLNWFSVPSPPPCFLLDQLTTSQTTYTFLQQQWDLPDIFFKPKFLLYFVFALDHRMDIFSISVQAALSTVAHCMPEGQPLVWNTGQCCPSGSCRKGDSPPFSWQAMDSPFSSEQEGVPWVPPSGTSSLHEALLLPLRPNKAAQAVDS